MSAVRPLVSLRNVNKTFNQGSSNEVRALQEINLDIFPSDFVSLIGPSGCGKSTLLRLVGDLLPPTTGTVRVKDKSAHQARLDREYGMVFQQATLYDWRTVSKNVELPLEVMEFDSEKRLKRVKEMMQLVQLEDFGSHYPWQLSGGMQQRVAIARALAFEPSILLMDEPFGALDEMTRERMQMELLNIWRQTDLTVIFVTHSIAEAVFISSRVAIMSARPGRIVEEIDVDLPRPRGFQTREDPRFFEIVTTVRASLRRDETREEN